LCHSPIKPDLLGFPGISVFACGLRDHVITMFASLSYRLILGWNWLVCVTNGIGWYRDINDLPMRLIDADPLSIWLRNPQTNDTTLGKPRNQVWKCNREYLKPKQAPTLLESKTPYPTNSNENKKYRMTSKDNYSLITQFSSLENQSRRQNTPS
jgi:hypothetical protein